MKPGRPLFTAALLYLFLGCAAFFWEPVFLVWIITGSGLGLFVLADALILLFLTGRLRVRREIPCSLAQGEPVRVKLFIRRAAARSLLPAAVLLYDMYPSSMRISAANKESADSVFPARIDRKLFKQFDIFVFEYTLLPEQRGLWHFSGVDLLLVSPLHCWKLRVTHKAASAGRTYPNFKKLAGGGELYGLSEKGEMREIRRRGQGMEFESLRDYQEGDSIRSIDWQATSRTRHPDGRLKLIVRDYQEEQDQQVLFIIDSGYRLPDVHFDSALNAMLLLSYTALKHGDAVAAASFGASERWIPPRKGMSALTGLLNGLYDLHSAPVPSSPFSALENALTRLRRRSFIILVSNFREEDGESLSWILPRIERRHLLLLVSFRESGAETLAFPAGYSAVSKNCSAGQILETAAAFSYLASRRRLYQKWEHSGLLIMETSPEHISPALINRYLSVKRSGKL
ncbi:MAG: DUF58 domain-containing protein [Treponema sp.]|jgi:uncharacterized protein (DUF58 family)|nr:DUF58 domain-containing protein [Treponema sp.]